MTTKANSTSNNAISIERTAVWFTLLATVGIVAVHLIAAIAQRYLSGTGISPWWITVGTILFAAIIAPRTSTVLPAWLDGTVKIHPVKAGLFILVALTTIVQTARITTHRAGAGDSFTILTSNEFWTKHECGTSYFHACELHDRNEDNIYHSEHYPVLNREAEPHTDIEGMKVEDSYQYPPQFLLLPKTILAFTNHYPTIRIVWFALQFLGVAAVFLLLARWVGETAGRWMAMLAPVVIVSPAALFAYQYTQFHLVAIVLAVAGMLAFEKNRNALGGALLAFAIIGKIFPGFLVILLLAEKRWKPMIWTFVFGLAYTIAALIVVGLEPFQAFFSYQLPRMQSFAAFAFLETWPEVRVELITANLSPFGQVMRLAEMGIAGMSEHVGSVFNSLFTFSLIPLILLASRKMTSNIRRTQIWLAVLGLASMASPAAWGDYVPVAALWLITVLASDAANNRPLAITLGVCGIFFYFLIGLVPLGQVPAPMVTYTLASITFVLLAGLKGWVIFRKPAFKHATVEQPEFGALTQPAR